VLLRARIVVPVTAPPVEDGAVAVSGDRVVAVGSWRELSAAWPGPVTDLGEVILLPGLVNAHCHLDYTGLAGQLAPPRTFPDWIKAILAAKGAWTNEDFTRSWLDGAAQLLASGTTTVANTESLSAGLAERLGFSLEGRLREHETTHKGLCDMLVYGLLRREWAAGTQDIVVRSAGD
jgi:cytosine/adenosine deaminase-related metal-dependent hydrolase